MQIVILDQIHQDGVALLQAEPNVRVITWDMPEALEWVTTADALIVRGSPVTAQNILAAKKLRVVGRHGAGYDKVDIEAMKAKGVALVTTPFENTQSVAELTVGFMLAASRNILAAHMSVCNEEWARAKATLGGAELFEHPVGFVGFGRIAQTVATILRTAFGMRIFAYDPFISKSAWNTMKFDVTPCSTVNELFGVCDFLSVHVPKTPETVNMIGKEQFDCARNSLVLVNTARGGVIDEGALYTALVNKQIRAAACDVFAEEPLVRSNPLLQLSNFIATPHYAGSTGDCLRRVGIAVARETLACLLGNSNPAYRVL